MTYAEKLRDPRWQKMRLQIFGRDLFSCRHCGADNKELQVHHLRYYNIEPWQYHHTDLLTLCIDCHADETKRRKINDQFLLYSLANCNFSAYEIQAMAQLMSKYPGFVLDLKKLIETTLTIENG